MLDSCYEHTYTRARLKIFYNEMNLFIVCIITFKDIYTVFYSKIMLIPILTLIIQIIYNHVRFWEQVHILIK